MTRSEAIDAAQTGKKGCTLGRLEARSSCSVVLLWSHLTLPLPSSFSFLLCCSSACVCCEILHGWQPSAPHLGPQRTGTKEPSEESYGLASALRGASWFPLVRVLHSRKYAECSANGAGRRHDSVRVKERRGRERRWRSVPCVAHCAPLLLLSSTAPRTCPERGPFVENMKDGEERDDQ